MLLHAGSAVGVNRFLDKENPMRSCVATEEMLRPLVDESPAEVRKTDYVLRQICDGFVFDHFVIPQFDQI
jgi:hypothetical protein